MVDKSPEFLQSTLGFPGELKMGIFVKRGNFGGVELAGGWWGKGESGGKGGAANLRQF